MNKTRRAGVYARISRDDTHEAKGVTRQIDDCTHEATRRGWTVVDTYTDNDVSATHAKVRPAYQRMLADAEAGLIDAVICWDVDRLTRKPMELEAFIDLADRHSLALASVGGEIDIATPQGRLTARLKGAVARHEAEQMARRVARKAQADAEAGHPPSGPDPFGYERGDKTVDGHAVRTLIHHPVEAPLLRNAYERIIGGDSLRSITTEWEAGGVRTRNGKIIRPSALRNMLRRPVHAGIRTWRGGIAQNAEGEVVGNWEPIVSRETWGRVQAILNDPSRLTTRGTAPRHLLSGHARCALCGGVMRMSSAHQLRCQDCRRLAREVGPVEEFVEDVVITYLERLNLDLTEPEDGSAYGDAVDKRDDLLARMDALADDYVGGLLTARQVKRATDALQADLTRAESRVMALAPNLALRRASGPTAREAWAASTMEQRRQIVRDLCDVTIHRGQRGGRGFDPASVDITWRDEAVTESLPSA